MGIRLLPSNGSASFLIWQVGNNHPHVAGGHLGKSFDQRRKSAALVQGAGYHRHSYYRLPYRSLPCRRRLRPLLSRCISGPIRSSGLRVTIRKNNLKCNTYIYHINELLHHTNERVHYTCRRSWRCARRSTTAPPVGPTAKRLSLPRR